MSEVKLAELAKQLLPYLPIPTTVDGVTIGSGVTDHGSLSGLSDDDHTQYVLVDGSRSMTGPLTVDLGATPGEAIIAQSSGVDTTIVAKNTNASPAPRLHLKDASSVLGIFGIYAQDLYVVNQQSGRSIYFQVHDQTALKIAFTITADGVSGMNRVAQVGDGTLNADFVANGGNQYFKTLWLKTAGSGRWLVGSSNENETGSNAGSNFLIQRYNDAGVYIANAMYIRRSDGFVSFDVDDGVPVKINAAGSAYLWLATNGSNKYAWVEFQTIANPRWRISKDAIAESGSNLGSNFRLYRYSDGGVYLGTTIGVERDTGNVFFGDSADFLWAEDYNRLIVNFGGSPPAGWGGITLRPPATGSQALFIYGLSGQTMDVVTIYDYVGGSQWFRITNTGAFEGATFSSGVYGWQITQGGDAEFNNIRARGAIKASIFEYGDIQATAGTLMVGKSAGKLHADYTTPASYPTGSQYLEIDHDTSGTSRIANGDVIRIKILTATGVADAWFTVSAQSPYSGYSQYLCTFVYGSTSTTLRKGTAVMDYGQSGDGVISLSADGVVGASANISLITHTGSPWTTQTLRTRLGNMYGSYGAGTNNRYGIGIGDYSSGNYLSYNAEAADTFKLKVGNGAVILDADGITVDGSSATYIWFKSSGEQRFILSNYDGGGVDYVDILHSPNSLNTGLLDIKCSVTATKHAQTWVEASSGSIFATLKLDADSDSTYKAKMEFYSDQYYFLKASLNVRIYVGDVTGSNSLDIRGGAGNYRGLIFKSADVYRWQVCGNNTAEGGGNTGTDLEIHRYADNGAWLGRALYIRRSDGYIITEQSLQIGTESGSNSIFLTGAAGNTRRYAIWTGGSYRWSIEGDNVGESGSNVGTNLLIARFSDAGGFLGYPMKIERNTGEVQFGEAAGVAIAQGLYVGSLTGTTPNNGEVRADAGGNNRYVFQGLASGTASWIAAVLTHNKSTGANVIFDFYDSVGIRARWEYNYPNVYFDNRYPGGAMYLRTTTGGSSLQTALILDSAQDVYTNGWTDYGGSTTTYGWGSFTLKKVYYKRIGKLCFVAVDIDGTSNGTTASCTLPYTSANNGFTYEGAFQPLDAGAFDQHVGYWQISSNSNTLSFYRNQGANWSTTGRKLCRVCVFYQTA